MVKIYIDYVIFVPCNCWSGISDASTFEGYISAIFALTNYWSFSESWLNAFCTFRHGCFIAYRVEISM